MTSGLVDSGYIGALGALLTVSNPRGVQLQNYARIAQAMVSQTTCETTTYQGAYQYASSLAPSSAFAVFHPEGEDQSA